MKKTKTFVLAVLLFALPLLVESQNSILEKKVTLNFTSANIEDVLKNISDQTGAPTQFSNNNFDPSRKVNININNGTVKDALTILLNGTQIKFKEFQNQLLLFSEREFTLNGYITDSIDGEVAIGTVLFVKGTRFGASTNLYGFYSITLPEGSYDIVYSCVGYTAVEKHIVLNKNIALNIKISNAKNELKEIVITADYQKEQVHSTQMGTISIPVDQIKNIPTIGGETDIIKVMQLMPGIKRGGEGQNGMFVRGGSGDDNLILLDEAVVYNVSHLFGFFSVFNNDALKDVTMIKGGFPAKYGGRLSSVMDVRMKEGDSQHFHAEGGIGLLSSRLTIQGPLKKDALSFIVSGRRSYIDQVFKLVKTPLPYYFYDLTGKINYRFSNKDRLYLSSYRGDDILSASSNSGPNPGGFKIGNFTTSLRWNHVYNPKLFSNLSFIHTRFRYDVDGKGFGNSLFVKSSIKDLGVKMDFDYFLNPRNHISYGYLFTNHNFRPNVINTTGEISQFLKSKEGKLISTQESGIYFNTEHKLDSLIKINPGIRFSLVATDRTIYTGLEPRLSATYSLSDRQSIKLGYSRMKQYMHLVSSSSIALPTDLWYPVTKRVKPESSDQVAIGYTQKIQKINSLLTVESYYKWLNNLIEYREGAILLLNDNYENELVVGKGKAYGVEVLLQKQSGKLTGWIGYTLSWSTRNFNELNKGKTYFAKYDRRHDFSIVGTYAFTKRFSFSAVWVFATGQKFTAITGNYIMPNVALTSIDLLNIYSDKNAILLPPSHRLDINFIFKTRHRKKWADGEWQIGCYNFYNRAQPYKVKIISNDNGTYKYQAVGLFGFIPSVAYNFKF
jgi:hypothetical protein